MHIRSRQLTRGGHMADLHTIIYVSSAVRLFDEEELERLLADARHVNRLQSITGVLLYCDGNFMQCIEGPEAALTKTFQRISESKRHKDVIEILHMPIESRNFESWEMGIARPTKSELLTLSDAISTAESKINSSSPTIGLDLLKSFLVSVRA